MRAKTKKTPVYTQRAIEKYQSKFERITISFPIGTREKISALTGDSVNVFVNRAVAREIERLEKEEKAFSDS